MPANPPPVKTERDAFIAYLFQQRDGLRCAAFGLTEEQIRVKPTRSALSVGGLIKHCAVTERGWLQVILGEAASADEQAYLDNFALTDEDTLDSLLAELDRVAQQTESVIRGLDDLGDTVQLPQAPWYPRNPEGYSARWILFHVLEELARHAGHADIIREHIDGATMYELLAGAEGWPETDWIKPWKPDRVPAR